MNPTPTIGEDNPFGLTPITEPSRASGPKLVTRALSLTRVVAQYAQNAGPEGFYAQVGDYLAELEGILVNLDGRRITDSLNDPTKQTKRSGAKKARRGTKAAKKRSR